MKKRETMLAIVMSSLLLLAGQGVAQAESEMDMSDREYCEQEAEQAGMIDAQDVMNYVAQCLDELKQMESDPESDDGHGDDGAEQG